MDEMGTCSGLSQSYYIDSISNNEEGFKIVLSESNNKEKKLLVIFENSVDCYRSTNESYTGIIIRELNEKYGKDFYVDWTFFKIIDSEHLKWLSEKSGGLSNTCPLQHLVFFSVDELLEVICTYEPIFEFINV
jgi:hypothetical protein